MIIKQYKDIVVEGYWFMLGDSRWLILSDESSLVTGRSAIPEEELYEYFQM